MHRVRAVYYTLRLVTFLSVGLLMRGSIEIKIVRKANILYVLRYSKKFLGRDVVRWYFEISFRIS